MRWGFEGLGEQPGDKSTAAKPLSRCCLAGWLAVVGRRGGVGVGGGGGRDGSLTCQRVRGWLKDSASPLSAPATSHLYCNANPRPVPDGAFPASWVHRNMIIYPEHFSSL